MRRALFALLLIGCASQQSKGPDVKVGVNQIGTSADMNVAGPITVQFEVVVANNTSEAVTLRRLDLATQGQGAYALRSSNPVNLVVGANSSASTLLYIWGRARGGYLGASEPVTIQGTAVFEDAAAKPFAKIFLQNLSQR